MEDSKIIKHELDVKDAEDEEVSEKAGNLRDTYIRIGNAVEHMTKTEGWQCLQAWFVKQFDMQRILNIPPEGRDKIIEQCRAYSDFLQTIKIWIERKDRCEREKEEIEKKKEDKLNA